MIASIACHGLIHTYGRRLAVTGLLVLLAAARPLVIPGIRMGTCFGTIYDLTIGDIAPSEAGSASGSLNAVQQLANAAGAAAVTTVYFRTPGGETHATVVSLVAVGAALMACLPLARLLPRKPQKEQHH